MNKKGFTLIELLAVIVIIVFIASIALILITNIIEKSKKAAFKDGIYSVFSAADVYLAKQEIINNSEGENNSATLEEGISVLDLNLKNNNFKSGIVILENNIIKVQNLSDGKYCANGSLKELIIANESCDISAPIVTILDNSMVFSKGTSYDLTTGFTNEDLESGIKSISITANGVPISNVESLDYGEYIIVYKVTNKVNLTTTKERNIKIINLSDYKYDFSYTGSVSEFTAQLSGYYKLEVWGAAGESGGYGAYASGVKYLESGEKLYIYVGDKGANRAGSAFNGGGICYGYSNFPFYGGGGATDIRTTQNTLYNDRIIVAGGGGGGGYETTGLTTSGYGGGGPAYSYVGIDTLYSTTTAVGGTCSVTHGGCWAASCSSYNYTSGCTAGGGGGYIGGAGVKTVTTGPTSNWPNYARCVAQGGTNYIGGVTSYKDEIAKSIFGNASMPTFSGDATMIGNLAVGHAKITLIEIN